jgi:hypothetical protein
MIGAWGQSISSTNGSLYQLRALDWVRGMAPAGAARRADWQARHALTQV